MIERTPITHEILAYKLDEMNNDMQDLKHAVETLNHQVHSMEGTLRRDKGFVAGALFIISGLWLALTSFKDVVAKVITN